MHSRDAALAPELVILSQSQGEVTTEEVMDWLRYEGVRHLRVNGEDLHGAAGFALRLLDAGPGAMSIRLHTEQGEVDLADSAACWFRRWHTRNALQYLIDPALSADGLATGQQIYKFLSDELLVLRLALMELFGDTRGLSVPPRPGHNKLTVLRLAAELGFRIPPTLVTNSRHELSRFMDEHGALITKPISECSPFATAAGDFVMFTSSFGPSELAALPERFFPSLFQRQVEKAYELRTFYLDGRCWTMTIFSQRRERTQVDFRHDAGTRQTRHVPFALPREVEERIGALMRTLGLRTGSVDLIRTPDGEYVFLEINPVGQFGMVSYPCNYRLEHHVARYLRDLCRREPGRAAGAGAAAGAERRSADARPLLGDARPPAEDQPALGTERSVPERGYLLSSVA